jgi:hypothetical protein
VTPIAFKGGEHHLGIAAAAEAMALGFEPQPQSGEIVDLAIERVTRSSSSDSIG